MDIVIDFKNIQDKQSLYVYLKDVFCDCEFYGSNLDALMEVLMCLKDKNIIIRNVDVLKDNLGDYIGKYNIIHWSFIITMYCL